jgi:hypothetical protein
MGGDAVVRLRCVVVLLVLVLGACGPSEPDPPAQTGGANVGPTAAGSDVPTYERTFAFAGFAGDSVILVPWLLRTYAGTDSVVHEAHGWLGRRGTWDAFYAERWTTPPTRAPSRVLPHGSLRLLVQQDDVIDGIVFGDGARRLELSLGQVRSTWGGPKGESIELLESVGYIADQRIEGTVMHMARASAGGAPPGGDWGLLVSGDSLQLVLAADVEHGGEAEPVYRGYAYDAGSERLWTDVRLTWTTTEAFPPARRDVPVAWRLASADGSLSGELNRVSADIQAGTGRGPLLPVRALYEVEGLMRVAGRTLPVKGLLVHERR